MIPRAVYDAMHDEANRILARAEAAEAEVGKAWAERDRLKQNVFDRAEAYEKLMRERDRLATALATAQARIETARAEFGCAMVQLLPSDDTIIADHIRAAHNALSPATGTGHMPATQKGTGTTCLDTGTSGGGASLAAASDYEAVCGSCGKPQP